MKFSLYSLLLKLFFLFTTVTALKDLSVKIENNVYVVDIKNYDKIVLDKTKDVFVMFYSPICPFSQKLLPTWEKLGERYKSQSNDIIFAKFDGTDVDVPETSPWIELEEFPTLVFFSKTDIDKKNYYVYPSDGSRTLANLANFIKATSTNKNEIVLTEEEMNEEDNYEDVTPLEEPEEPTINENEELDDEQINEFLKKNYDINMDDIREEANKEEEENKKNYRPLREDPKYVRVGVSDEEDAAAKETKATVEETKTATEETKTEAPKAKKTEDPDAIPRTASGKDEL